MIKAGLWPKMAALENHGISPCPSRRPCAFLLGEYFALLSHDLLLRLSLTGVA